MEKKKEERKMLTREMLDAPGVLRSVVEGNGTNVPGSFRNGFYTGEFGLVMLQLDENYEPLDLPMDMGYVADPEMFEGMHEGMSLMTEESRRDWHRKWRPSRESMLNLERSSPL
jgi:hypothetical protein